MANVSDFYNRLVTTQVCVRKPAAACPFSWRSSHSLASCPLLWISAQVQLPVRSRGKLLVCVSAVRARQHSAQTHSFTSCRPSIFTAHTTLLWDIFNSRKRASSMPWIPKTSPFRFLRVLLKNGPNQRSDLYAQTANPLSEESVFQSEDLKNLCKLESGGGWESPVCLVFVFVDCAMVVAVES